MVDAPPYTLDGRDVESEAYASPTQARVLAYMQGRNTIVRTWKIRKDLMLTNNAVAKALQRLRSRGFVEMIAHGCWKLVEAARESKSTLNQESA